MCLPRDGAASARRRTAPGGDETALRRVGARRDSGLLGHWVRAWARRLQCRFFAAGSPLSPLAGGAASAALASPASAATTGGSAGMASSLFSSM